MSFVHIIPVALGIVFLFTAIWNSLFDRQVRRWLVGWGLSPNWRHGVAGMELLTAFLLLAGSGTVAFGMLLTAAILCFSIGLSIYQRAYGRLLLSVPMLLAVAYFALLTS